MPQRLWLSCRSRLAANDEREGGDRSCALLLLTVPSPRLSYIEGRKRVPAALPAEGMPQLERALWTPPFQSLRSFPRGLGGSTTCCWEACCGVVSTWSRATLAPARPRLLCNTLTLVSAQEHAVCTSRSRSHSGTFRTR